MKSNGASCSKSDECESQHCADAWPWQKGKCAPIDGRGQAGDYCEVQAHHLGQVVETDENNNTKSWTIVVGQVQPPTPPPPAEQISLRADAPYVNAGGCTMLRWDVEGVQAAYLDGAGVVGHGSQQVCPCAATTYTLEVVKMNGQRETRQVFIDVYGSCGGIGSPTQPPGGGFDTPSQPPGGDIFTPIEPPGGGIGSPQFPPELPAFVDTPTPAMGVINW